LSQSFVASGNIAYFNCTQNGCNLNQPIALTLANINAVPTGFTAIIPVTIPQPQKTGSYKITYWGEDQDHYPYDITGTLSLVQSCVTTADCPPNSYCKNGPGQSPPYSCQNS
jgi:hypothetical protein